MKDRLVTIMVAAIRELPDLRTKWLNCIVVLPL